MLQTKFQASQHGGSEEEDFEYISMVRTWDPLARGHLRPWNLRLNKLSKGPLGHATY